MKKLALLLVAAVFALGMTGCEKHVDYVYSFGFSSRSYDTSRPEVSAAFGYIEQSMAAAFDGYGDKMTIDSRCVRDGKLKDVKKTLENRSNDAFAKLDASKIAALKNWEAATYSVTVSLGDGQNEVVWSHDFTK